MSQLRFAPCRKRRLSSPLATVFYLLHNRTCVPEEVIPRGRQVTRSGHCSHVEIEVACVTCCPRSLFWVRERRGTEKLVFREVSEEGFVPCGATLECGRPWSAGQAAGCHGVRTGGGATSEATAPPCNMPTQRVHGGSPSKRLRVPFSGWACPPGHHAQEAGWNEKGPPRAPWARGIPLSPH